VDKSQSQPQTYFDPRIYQPQQQPANPNQNKFEVEEIKPEIYSESVKSINEKSGRRKIILFLCYIF
jgi:hypothetical protein